MAEALLHRIPQALTVLPVGRSTLFELIRSGEIATVKIGRSTLIPHDEIVRFIERRRSGVDPRPAA